MIWVFMSIYNNFFSTAIPPNILQVADCITTSDAGLQKKPKKQEVGTWHGQLQ